MINCGPKSAEIVPKSAEVDQHCPGLDQHGLALDQIWPEFDEILPDARPKLAPKRQHLACVRGPTAKLAPPHPPPRIQTKLDLEWTTNCTHSANLGPSSTKVVPKSVGRPESARNHPKMAQHCPRLAQHRNLYSIGQHCPRYGQHFPKTTSGPISAKVLLGGGTQVRRAIGCRHDQRATGCRCHRRQAHLLLSVCPRHPPAQRSLRLPSVPRLLRASRTCPAQARPGDAWTPVCPEPTPLYARATGVSGRQAAVVSLPTSAGHRSPPACGVLPVALLRPPALPGLRRL